MHPTASFLVSLGMAAIVFAVAALDVLAVRAVRPAWSARAAVIAVAWIAATGALAGSGLLARFELRPPPALLLFPLMLAAGISIGASSVGAALAELPLWAIVGFHAFRLPLELLLHAAAREGTMPTVMSFSGRNFDIATGVLALACAIALRLGAPRALGWLVAIVGSVLLLAIAGIALASTPAFQAFGPDQLNTFVAYVPFVWLPEVLVVSALAGQIVLVRALRRRQ